jgi:hypothetical protein
MLPRPSSPCSALFVPQSGLTMPVVGWFEQVKIYPGEMILEAKLDPGAKTAPIGARDDLRAQGRLGGALPDREPRWARPGRNAPRETKVKRHFGKRQRRPVVKLGVCVGDLVSSA